MIADIIVILVMALTIFLGYKRGLIGVAVKLLGFVISLVIALIFYTPVSDYIINNTDIVANLEEVIESKIYSGDEEESTEEANTISASMEQYIEDYTEEAISSGAEYIAENVAISVVKVRNMDSFIFNSKSTYDIHKNICRHYKKYTNHKAI